MTYETIETRAEDRVGVVTFNRPRVLNAFDPVLIRETTDALSQFEREENILAVVVHGAGRAFSAGFDMKATAAMGDIDAARWRRILEADFDFIMRFWDCSKPTIAAIHGYCIGGAFELALACDMAVAARSTRFGEPELRFGSAAVAMLLPWFTGPKQAKELLFTGNDKVTAERALAIGLLNEVTPDGQELERALAMAREVAACAPNSVRLTKQAINRGYDIMGFRQALRASLETSIVIEVSGGPERAEFNRIRGEQGLKAALAWRDGRFR